MQRGVAAFADDKSFDAVTIAFSLRNVTHKDRALAEMHRVLKVGGRALVLEFSRPNPLLKGPTTGIRSTCYRSWGQHRRRRRQLPIPGREHPHASATGRTEGDV